MRSIVFSASFSIPAFYNNAYTYRSMEAKTFLIIQMRKVSLEYLGGKYGRINFRRD
jgi:hypothetical protein